MCSETREQADELFHRSITDYEAKYPKATGPPAESPTTPCNFYAKRNRLALPEELFLE